MSGLKIYYSDRIEDLAGKLKEQLLAERTTNGNPFAFAKVVVPNANIAKWLQIRSFSEVPSLCMGVNFPFIEQTLYGLLADCLKIEECPQLLPMNAYTNGVMSILLKDNDARLEPFRRYIGVEAGAPVVIDSRSKARMAWQLSVKLANLIDKYEVHRRNIVEKWLDENRAALISDPTEKAEAALAQKLLGEGGLYPPSGDAVSLRQLFERVKKVCAKPEVEAKKIYFFGLSTLSSLQVEIIHYLAQTHDIEIYHNNVCLEYWGDIETKKEEARAERLKEKLINLKNVDDDLKLENSLLQNWGRAGRETLRLIVDLEEANGNSDKAINFEWNELSPSVEREGSMLEKVQSSVRHRVSEVGRIKAQDASIQIVGAPGIRREVEMVYNAILGAVWKPNESGKRPWSDCSFSDIAILVPDMKTYRPVIEAVFDGRDQIPYGLIDSSASEYSRYLDGFMALMAIAREGLKRETIFAALDNPCVQRALGFTSQDVKNWRRYTKEIGAFDGFEGVEPFENYSWDAALSRLRLGIVSKGSDSLAVWEGGDDSSLKFSEIVETLYRELVPLASKKFLCTAPHSKEEQQDNWADVLRRIAGEFLRNDHDDSMEESVSRSIFNMLYGLDRIEGEQSLDFVVAAVEELIGGIKCQKGGYLTHGVTIASLQPMRPVPFKQVFILGMGEGMFPGRDSETTLEIQGAARSLGDMGTTSINRYLFLETLMATRERLVISYPNRDIAKDAELFASGMVSELKEFLEQNVLPKTKDGSGGEKTEKFREVILPLLERGEKEDNLMENPVDPISWKENDYFAGLIPTYSNVERAIAWRVKNSALTTDAKPDDNDVVKSKKQRPIVTAKELAEFLDSPLRGALRRQYGIGIEGYRDETIDYEAPLEFKYGPVKWDFERAILENDGIEKVYKDFSERGLMPDSKGILGGYSLAKVMTQLEPLGNELNSIKSFVRNFANQEGFKKPDLVNVLFPAKYDKNKKLLRPEILCTAHVSDFVTSVNGNESLALVFKSCGDKRNSKTITLSKFPPKAVLEPLVTWLMMVAAKDGVEKCMLSVHIVDMNQVLRGSWSWETMPSAAKTYIEGLLENYWNYLADSDADGCYLDYGYSDMVKVLEKVSMSTEEILQIDNDNKWLRLIDAFSSDDYNSKNSTFNNNLVIERVVEEYSRMPDETDSDLKIVKDRFQELFKMPLLGKRIEDNGKGA
jgi:exonuclease V gamma subunit